MRKSRLFMAVLIVLLALAMLPSAALALSGDLPPEDPAPAAPADPEPEPVPVVVQDDLPGAPPPIGFCLGNPAAVVENGPAVGYDNNGVVPVTGSLSVTGGPFNPTAVVFLPIPEGYNRDSLALARWDAANNLWVLVPGSSPCGLSICGATSSNGVFAVVEIGWFK